jgi:thymidine kinase
MCVKLAIPAIQLMAKLYFPYAAMNAGKSTALLQAAYNYEERDLAVIPQA